MPRRTPSYRLHKPSGQAVVTLNGQDVYLGKWNSPESHAKYDRLVAEWLVNGRQNLNDQRAPGPSVGEVILAFMGYAQEHYPDSSREPKMFRFTLRPLRRLYSGMPAADFDAQALTALQWSMASGNWMSEQDKEKARKRGDPIGWCRNVVNRRIARVKTMWRWAESRKLVPPGSYHHLQTVRGLPKTAKGVRQTPKVRPAFWEQVAQVLPCCTRPVAAMLQLQCWTGMRSQEVRLMRTADIDRSDPRCWIYRPAKHKNEWRDNDQERIVALGPECQRILADWLREDGSEVFLFQPRQAVAERNAKRRASRKTPLTPSQRGRKAARTPRRAPGGFYSDTSYAQAVARACTKAKVKFHPYMLRHGCKMRIQRSEGMDAARAVLGQRSIQATQHYGGLDMGTAIDVMTRLG